MKTDFMVISFSDTGEASAMHRDNFDLGFLGKQKIERASEIKFNEGTQSWDIYLPTGVEIRAVAWVSPRRARGFASYNTARAVEVQWLERSALYDVEPISETGIELLREIRAELEV